MAMEISNEWAEGKNEESDDSVATQVEDGLPGEEAAEVDDPGYDDCEGDDSEETDLTVQRDEDETYWERLRIISELREARSNKLEANDELLSLRDKVKELKDEVSVWETKTNQLLDQLFKLESPTNPDGITGSESAAEKLPAVASRDRGVVEGEVAEDDSWRTIPTENIIAGVAGIGEKKRQSLLELAPTLGDLQDLRIEASTEFKQFKEKLPKGFGDGTVDAIETKIIDVIENWRQGDKLES